MELPILSALNDDERSAVLEFARRRHFGRNEIVYHEGDPGDTLHFIVDGHVAVRKTTERGEVATLAVLGSGDSFGELALLAGEAVRTATVAALESAETLSLHRSHLDRLREKGRLLDNLLLGLLATQVARLSDQLMEALYLPVGKRVYRRLVELGRLYAGDGRTIIPLTQDDIASLAGSTRPSTNQVLRTAEGRGLVAIGRGRIEILDLDGLVRRSR